MCKFNKTSIKTEEVKKKRVWTLSGISSENKTAHNVQCSI